MTSKYVKDFEAKEAFPWPTRPNLFRSVFSPDGLVPYPCTHGLPTLPADHPRVAGEPRLDSAGEEFAYGGHSWGRSKDLAIVAFGGRTSHFPNGQEVFVPMCIVKCQACIGLPSA